MSQDVKNAMKNILIDASKKSGAKKGFSLPDVAVLRGGGRDFGRSLQEGAEVLQSLTKLGYAPLDVLISKEGEWTLSGRPTDAHYIYTRSHTIIDTTRMKGSDYQELARKMGIALIFSEDDMVTMTREDMYRILRQQGFNVPNTRTIRASQPFNDATLRDIWYTFHTPLMIRPLVRKEGAESKLVTSFIELEKTLHDYHARGIDVHVLTYQKAPTSSVAAIPNFRGEEVYTPLWVETFDGVKQIPHAKSRIRAYSHVPEFRKKQMKELVTEVYKALGLSVPAVVDVIPRNQDYVVVNVETSPSLRKDGRFMRSLETTGVDIGQYIHTYIQNELER